MHPFTWETCMRDDKTLQLLRWTLGATAFVAGADKFTNLLTDWEKYLAPVVERNLPIGGRNFMRLVGVIEMLVGGLILSGHPKLGGYIASAWLLGISANLVMGGEYLDVAARDVNMAVAALAVASLSGIRSRETFDMERLDRAA
jgi:uncharacterized membrane protein YphA (DoxX/SURF4 family)